MSTAPPAVVVDTPTEEVPAPAPAAETEKEEEKKKEEDNKGRTSVSAIAPTPNGISKQESAKKKRQLSEEQKEKARQRAKARREQSKQQKQQPGTTSAVPAPEVKPEVSPAPQVVQGSEQIDTSTTAVPVVPPQPKRPRGVLVDETKNKVHPVPARRTTREQLMAPMPPPPMRVDPATVYRNATKRQYMDMVEEEEDVPLQYEEEEELEDYVIPQQQQQIREMRRSLSRSWRDYVHPPLTRSAAAKQQPQPLSVGQSLLSKWGNIQQGMPRALPSMMRRHFGRM